MAVHDIAYVELYTRDKVTAVDYLVSAMGFMRIADSVAADRSSILLRQGEVHLVVTSGRGIWKFLDEHGDGVADIALTCDDVARTRESAVAAGARLILSAQDNAVVSGLGPVSHSLLPRATGPEAYRGTRLPIGRRWTSAAAEVPRPRTSRPSRDGAAPVRWALDHIEIDVEGSGLLERAWFYRDAFGFSCEPSSQVVVAGEPRESVVVRSESGRVALTLLARATPTERVGRPPGERQAGQGEPGSRQSVLARLAAR
ncbi:hypothetical protein [Kitasatospora sp. NPDC004289]